MSHALFAAILETMEEFAVRYGSILVGGDATSRQESRKEFLFKVKAVLSHHVEEVVECDLKGIIME